MYPEDQSYSKPSGVEVSRNHSSRQCPPSEINLRNHFTAFLFIYIIMLSVYVVHQDHRHSDALEILNKQVHKCTVGETRTNSMTGIDIKYAAPNLEETSHHNSASRDQWPTNTKTTLPDVEYARIISSVKSPFMPRVFKHSSQDGVGFAAPALSPEDNGLVDSVPDERKVLTIPRSSRLRRQADEVSEPPLRHGRRGGQGGRGRSRENRQRPSWSAKKMQKKVKDVENKLKDLEGTKDRLTQLETKVNGGIPRSHFHANIHETWINHTQRTNESIATMNGRITPDGFIPHDGIYSFWKATEDTDKNIFLFNRDTGKVHIRQNGTYLIYAQIIYHDKSGRNAFGIYVDNKNKPIAQCLLYETRGNRSETNAEDIPQVEPQATAHNVYQQCNTLTVQVIGKDREVFTRSLYTGRALLTKEAVTFWGIVKLD